MQLLTQEPDLRDMFKPLLKILTLVVHCSLCILFRCRVYIKLAVARLTILSSRSHVDNALVV